MQHLRAGLQQGHGWYGIGGDGAYMDGFYWFEVEGFDTVGEAQGRRTALIALGDPDFTEETLKVLAKPGDPPAGYVVATKASVLGSWIQEPDPPQPDTRENNENAFWWGGCYTIAMHPWGRFRWFLGYYEAHTAVNSGTNAIQIFVNRMSGNLGPFYRGSREAFWDAYDKGLLAPLDEETQTYPTCGDAGFSVNISPTVEPDLPQVKPRIQARRDQWFDGFVQFDCPLFTGATGAPQLDPSNFVYVDPPNAGEFDENGWGWMPWPYGGEGNYFGISFRFKITLDPCTNVTFGVKKDLCGRLGYDNINADVPGPHIVGGSLTWDVNENPQRDYGKQNQYNTDFRWTVKVIDY